MAEETSSDVPTREQELKAVADAERDPETAMAQGKRTETSEPTDPANPSTHADGENYLGQTTIFTRPNPEEEQTR